MITALQDKDRNQRIGNKLARQGRIPTWEYGFFLEADGESNAMRKANQAFGQQVVVTYRASTDAKSAFIGEPIAVEFIKGDEK